MHRGKAQDVTGGEQVRQLGRVAEVERQLVDEQARCSAMAVRICVNMSAVSVHSTSTLNEGSMSSDCALRTGGSPWRMFISIGTASDTPAPASFTFCQLTSDIPVM